MSFEEKVWGLRDQGKTKAAVKTAVTGAVDALLMAAGIEVSCHEDPVAAGRLLRTVADLDPANAPALGTLCSLSLQMGDPHEAVRWGERAVQAEDTPDYLYNYGLALMHVGRYPDASAALKKVVAADPTNVLAHCHLANVLLAMGDFEGGLREDEWRLRLRNSPARRFNRVWDGQSDLAGRRVLVFNEQGTGDLINFARYLPRLKATGCFVILELTEAQTPLFYWAAGVDQLIHHRPGPPDTEYDVAVSVNSLPYLFDPRLDDTPMTVPYLGHDPLGPCQAEQFVREVPGFKIAVVYAGHRLHTNDSVRSCPLRHFKPLADLPGVSLVSLQVDGGPRSWISNNQSLFGTGDIEVVDLTAGCNMPVYDAGPLIQNYNDTARAILASDLVVSVDTGVAHLAGSLAHPTCLLLPFSHEWRWQKSWYPTMRMFRQHVRGDWTGLLSEVSQKIVQDSNVQNL